MLETELSRFDETYAKKLLAVLRGGNKEAAACLRRQIDQAFRGLVGPGPPGCPETPNELLLELKKRSPAGFARLMVEFHGREPLLSVLLEDLLATGPETAVEDMIAMAEGSTPGVD